MLNKATFTLLLFASLLGATFGALAVDPIGHHGSQVISALTSPTISSKTTTPPSVPKNETVQLTFSSQFKQYNKPFLVTCSVGGTFAGHETKNYSVVFYKTADTGKHAFGRFDVYLAPNQQQRIIFSDTVHASKKMGELSLTPIESSAYPNFTLLVSPYLLFRLENYWCELEVQNHDSSDNHHHQVPQVLATSNLWITTPIVSLTIETVPQKPDQYLARCLIEHFDIVDTRSGGKVINSSTVSYEVNYYIEDDRVAVFNVTPHKMEIFKPFQVPYELKRTILGHGTRVEYPVFEMLYSADDHTTRGYQCELTYNGLPPSYQGGNAHSKIVFSV